MTYYPTFNKCQDLGLQLQNKQAGTPLIFADAKRTRAIEVWPDRRVRMWAENQVVYSGYPDSEYDFNTLWEGYVTEALPPV